MRSERPKVNEREKMERKTKEGKEKKRLEVGNGKEIGLKVNNDSRGFSIKGSLEVGRTTTRQSELGGGGGTT